MVWKWAGVLGQKSERAWSGSEEVGEGRGTWVPRGGLSLEPQHLWVCTHRGPQPQASPGCGVGVSHAARWWPGNARLSWACQPHLRQHPGPDNANFMHWGAHSTNLLIRKVIQAMPKRSPHWAGTGEEGGARSTAPDQLSSTVPSHLPAGVTLELCPPAGQLGQKGPPCMVGAMPQAGVAHMWSEKVRIPSPPSGWLDTICKPWAYNQDQVP